MAASLNASSAPSNGSGSIHCFERAYWGRQAKAPVSLVVFDFDETLTTVSAFPTEKDFEKTIGFQVWEEYTNWSYELPQEDYDGRGQSNAESRISKLSTMLQRLVGSDDQRRTLVIITRNTRGVVACLNSLMNAGLSDYFSVILGMQDIKGLPQGVYLNNSEWKTFHPPPMKWDESKADVLSRILDAPKQWIPQLVSAGEGSQFSSLRELKMANVVLVDNEEENFQSESTKVLRCCKVNTYAAHHPKLGYQEDMGGIGAHCDEDYKTLADFVEQPWNFPWHRRGAAEEGAAVAERRASQPMRGSEPTERRPTQQFRGNGNMERGMSMQADMQVGGCNPMVDAGSQVAAQAGPVGPANCAGFVPPGFVGYVMIPMPAVPFQPIPVSAQVGGSTNFQDRSRY